MRHFKGQIFFDHSHKNPHRTRIDDLNRYIHYQIFFVLVVIIPMKIDVDAVNLFLRAHHCHYPGKKYLQLCGGDEPHQLQAVLFDRRNTSVRNFKS